MIKEITDGTTSGDMMGQEKQQCGMVARTM
jgi:hypothetical protein